MKMRSSLLALLAAFVLGACGEAMERPPPANGSGGSGGDGGSGDPIGPGGSGGSGGEDGGGGTGGSGGSDVIGGVPPNGSGWEDVRPALAWRHQGFGEAFELLVADFTGDGKDEIAVGARRPFLLEGDGASVAWFAEWGPAEWLTQGGDSTFVYGLAAIPSDRGGADLLVTSRLGDAFLVEGSSGERLWHSKLDVSFPFVEFALFGAPEDPLFFAAYGQKAYRARTGEPEWEVDVRKPVWADALRTGDGPPGLLLGTEMGVNIGDGGGFVGVPAIYAFDHEGALIFERGFPDRGPLTRIFTADLDGAGVDSPILQFGDNLVVALHPDGSDRWETTVSIFAADWHHMLESHDAADVDGDGKAELLLVYTDGSMPTRDRTSTAVLLGHDGAIRWTHDFPHLTERANFARAGEETIILAAVGNRYTLSPGALVVLDPNASAEDGRILLEEESFDPITHATLIERDGEIAVAYTGLDAFMRTVRFPGGGAGWEHYWLNWVEKTAAVEDDGASHLAVADKFGTLSLLDASGGISWSRTLAEGTAYEVTALASGHLGGETRILAAANAVLPEGRAVIEAFAMRGQQRLNWVQESPVLALHVADLDGDGRSEILHVSGMRDDDDVCSLHVLDEAGLPLHEMDLGVCSEAGIATGDGDGDGKKEIAVRIHPGFLSAPPRLFFLEHDASLRWFFDESVEITEWVAFAPNGLVAGGGTVSGDGFVALREYATGEKSWRTTLPDDKEEFGTDSSWYGVVFHSGGDYVATHTLRGAVYLLDLGSGEIYWEGTSDHPDESPTEDHDGAPLAFVPATDETPAFLTVSQGGVGSKRSRIYAVSLAGEFLWEYMMSSTARSAHTIRLLDGRPAALVVSQLGVHAVAAEKEASP